VRSLKQPVPGKGGQTVSHLWKKTVLTLIGLFVFSFLFERLGFLISSFLFMVFLLKLVGGQRWVYTVGIAVLTSAACYLLFGRLSDTALPSGILGMVLW
jgi:hypothetical protein